MLRGGWFPDFLTSLLPGTVGQMLGLWAVLSLGFY